MQGKVEVEVIQPLWFEGAQIELKEGEPAPVIPLPKSEAVYLQSIGRVRIIEAETVEAKPKKAKAK